MKRFRSLLKKFLLFVAGILVVLLLVTVILGVKANREVKSELARIKARGEPLRFADLGGPPVPDKDNAAVLYRKAFQMMNTPPIADHVKVLESFYQCPIPPKVAVSIQLDSAIPALDGVESVIALLEKASQKPACRFPVDWASGTAATFKHYASLGKCAKLVAIGAVVRAMEGKPEQAVRLLKLGVAIAQSIKDEKCLMSFLSSGAMLSATTNALENVLERCDLSAQQSRELFGALGRVDLMRAYKNAMIGERTFGLCVFEQADISTGVWWLFSKLDEWAYLSLMRRQIEMANLTYREAKERGLESPSKLTAPFFAPITMLASVAASSWKHAFILRDTTIAELAIARTALAIEAYKSKFGHFPDSISELKSKLGWKIPPDPFSGQDLKFRRSGTGYILYSIGADLKDNGGVPRKLGTGDVTSPGDIVLSMAR